MHEEIFQLIFYCIFTEALKWYPDNKKHNGEFLMKRIAWSSHLLMTLFLFLYQQSIASSQSDKDPITYGHYRKIYSKIIGEERTLLIHLPLDYESSNKNYPALYVLDGEKEVFLQSVTTTWYLRETAQKIPGYIVIGIPNTDRRRDMDTGKENFHRFIESELIPFIDSTYRTNDFKILCGQSASSIFTFDSFLKNPNLFNMYILISFGLSKNSLSPYKDQIVNSKEIKRQGHKHLFFSNAKTDPYDPSGERTENAKLVYDLLKKHLPQTNQLTYRTYDDEGHVPFPSLYDALKGLHHEKK